MNIETANRLYEYRKSMGLSQEELASKIGVSRQAVSKWERAEASPDTDNLIELSKVYGVTLDEMLRGKEDDAPAEAPSEEAPAEEPVKEQSAEEQPADASEEGKDKVQIGWHGIHVHDKHGAKVDIDRHGIFVEENGEKKVYTDENGHVHRCDDRHHHERNRDFWHIFPYPALTVIAYLLFGFFNVCGGWAWGWIVFLTIPLYYTIVDAIQKRNPNHFAYPVLALIAFLILGIYGFWHPGWVAFLTIPVYYGIVNAFRGSKKEE